MAIAMNTRQTQSAGNGRKRRREAQANGAMALSGSGFVNGFCSATTTCANRAFLKAA